MKTEKKQPAEFKVFDAFIKKLIAVSRNELQEREKSYKTQRQSRKRAKA
jgi:hypothetical protein